MEVGHNADGQEVYDCGVVDGGYTMGGQTHLAVIRNYGMHAERRRKSFGCSEA